jgi:hypothetical protein
MPWERRSSIKESQSWLPPSQVFADTQKVDLFNDPRWETTPGSPARRPVADESRRRPTRVIGKASAFRRVLMKRGRHSRNLV